MTIIWWKITLSEYRPLSHNAETKDFARPTSHPVRGWTGKNKAFCSPGTQNGRRVIKVYPGTFLKRLKGEQSNSGFSNFSLLIALSFRVDYSFTV